MGGEAINMNFFKRYFHLTYFFIAPRNSLKLVGSYSFITGGDRKKLSTIKPVDIQGLFYLKEPRAS